MYLIIFVAILLQSAATCSIKEKKLDRIKSFEGEQTQWDWTSDERIFNIIALETQETYDTEFFKRVNEENYIKVCSSLQQSEYYFFQYFFKCIVGKKEISFKEFQENFTHDKMSDHFVRHRFFHPMAAMIAHDRLRQNNYLLLCRLN